MGQAPQHATTYRTQSHPWAPGQDFREKGRKCQLAAPACDETQVSRDAEETQVLGLRELSGAEILKLEAVARFPAPEGK